MSVPGRDEPQDGSRAPALLSIRNVAKAFAGVQALQDVSFDLHEGRVVTLAGENGAGKSTLLGILGGSLVPDRGTVTIGGSRRTEYTPRRALAEGVVIARQEPAIVPQLTVEQNLLLGHGRAERRTLGPHVEQAMRDLNSMGFPVSRAARMSRLSPAQRHAVTIAKAFTFGARIVALDEPTTSMLEHNVEAVLARVRELAHERRIGVIFVSHKMPEVMAVSDDVVVLRDGKVGFTAGIAQTTDREIVRNMVGRELLDFDRPARLEQQAAVRFAVTGITHPMGVGPIDLSVKAGEVVGIAGLVGSGRTEFLRAVIRADAGCAGDVRIDGRHVRIHTPHDSRRAGIAFIPEDRKAQGLVMQVPAFANMAMTNAPEFRRGGGLVSLSRQARVADGIGAEMSLRPANVRLKARQFSGGNQQKVVIAKWLRSGSSVFLFDEPTKGVDVGGRAEIYGLIDQLAAQGNAVVVVSSDLPEIIALSDRVMVMRGGQLVAEHVGDDINEHSIVANAMGLGKESA